MNTVQNNALGQALNNDSNAKVVYNPRVSNAPNKMLVSISRVILADDYTAIECAVDNTHGAYSYIAIDSETWITPNESHIVEEQLTEVEGILDHLSALTDNVDDASQLAQMLADADPVEGAEEIDIQEIIG